MLGLNDVERLQCEGRGNRADVRSLIRFAMTLAGIGNLNFLGHSLEARSRLLEGVVPSQKQVESLEQRRVTVVTIRTRHVQNFIYRSQRHYHMRGASVWCSLSLSLLRDALMSVDSPFGDRVMVLSDSDNGFQLAFGLENDRGETADDLNARVRAAVRDVLTVFNDGTRTPFHNHFPGLTQWIREAQANGIQLTDALPSYQVEAENVSLLDLATDETVFKPDYEKSEEGVIKLPSTPVSDEDECSDRENDRAVFSQTPPWHNESQSEGEYGWPTLLFSRVGSSYRMRTQLALGEEVREHDELKASLLSPWFYRRDLKRHFGDEAGNFRISFAIVDGDRIRRRFVERSTLTRPAESAHLASRFYHLWISALRQSLSTGNASKTADRTRILPIDIVYFGGDDIVFLGPEEIVSPIVSAILNSGPDDEISSDGPAEDGVVADERPLTFSGATIEFNDSDDDDRRMTEAAVKNLYNSLKCVKRKKKNGQLEMDESSLRQEFLKYGYEASLTRTGRWLRVQITRFADS